MKREKLVLYCCSCGETNIINPPRKKLKKTDTIELNCYTCGETNNYKFIYKLRLKK